MKRQFHAENANRTDIARMAAVGLSHQPEKELDLELDLGCPELLPNPNACTS